MDDSGHLQLVNGDASVRFTGEGIVGQGSQLSGPNFVPWESVSGGLFIGVPAVGVVGTRLIHALGGSGLYEELVVSVASSGFSGYGWTLGRPIGAPFPIRSRNATEWLANALSRSPRARTAVRVLGDRDAGPRLVGTCLASSSWSRWSTERRVGGIVQQWINEGRI